MAININKEPINLYPAYNDSWLEFTSTLSNNNRAEITISGMPTFTLYPLNGIYLINLKEIVKSLINVTGFKDTLSVGIPWGYSMTNNFLSLDLNIKVYSAISSENVDKTYTFYKYVKQIGETIFNNNGQILLPTDNGVDYSATYWEGFPFDFSLQRISTVVKVKNLNTTQETPNITPTVTGTMRVVVDKGGSANNWTDTSFLPLPDVINRLEISEGGTFKSNLRLKKRNKACGVYLKWFNSQGGYSYFLFDEFYKESVSTGTLATISQNNFLNINNANLSGTKKITGKSGVRVKELKTVVDQTELRHLEDIFTSPYIQMYSSERAYEEGRWIDVTLTTNSNLNATKKDIQDIRIGIEMPELINTML